MNHDDDIKGIIRQTILLVQSNVKFFRGQWDVFLEQVDAFAPELTKWYTLFGKNQEYRIALSRRLMIFERRIEVRKKAGSPSQIAEEEAKCEQALDDAVREIEEIENRISAEYPELKDRVEWCSGPYCNSQVMCDVPFWCPPDLADPVRWCLKGNGNHRSPTDREALLADSVRLSVLNDRCGELTSTDRRIIAKDPNWKNLRRECRFLDQIDFSYRLYRELVADSRVPESAIYRLSPVVRGGAEQEQTSQASAHSPDFASVIWYGNQHTFTPTQAACVKILWEAWESGTPEVDQAYILTSAGSECQRLRDLFRKSTAWGTMIRKGKMKSSFRLWAENDKK